MSLPSNLHLYVKSHIIRALYNIGENSLGILAAIALPAYQNYTKRSANSACLAEAKTVAGKFVIELQDPSSTKGSTGIALNEFYTKGSACEGAKVAAADATALTSVDTTTNVTLTTEAITFTPKAPGDKQVICNIASGGNCSISAVGITNR